MSECPPSAGMWDVQQTTRNPHTFRTVRALVSEDTDYIRKYIANFGEYI